MALTVALGCSECRAQLTPERVLLLYNSENAESQAVRDLYVAARPGVLEFDLDRTNVQPGQIARAAYLARIATPLANFLTSTDPASGDPYSERVIAIATTRGLPGRIAGGNEFSPNSNWASLESELSLVLQDLESGLPPPKDGAIDNPYHRAFNQPIDAFTRDDAALQREGQQVALGAWRLLGAQFADPDLAPGDIFLVCRLDASPTDGASAVDNIAALIERSRSLIVHPEDVQSLFDEWGCVNQLDDDAYTFLFPATADFELAHADMLARGVASTHDETGDFLTQPELPDPSLPLLALASYGSSHGLMGCGDDAPGDGTTGNTWLGEYTLHPAASLIALESFNGDSIVDGDPRQEQGQALDFISFGGSFAFASLREPFTFGQADAEPFLANLLDHGLTFAEAAYSAIPALSWQITPIGDPLATVRLACPGDATGDGAVDFEDLNALLVAFGATGEPGFDGDADLDGDADFDDLNAILVFFGTSCR